MKPLISVVTVCFNAEKDIERTIDSLLSQSFENVECVFVDGKSADSTVSIIENRLKNNQNYILVSEKDSGIFNAMNKGVKLASGEWIIFINAGDTFFDNDVLLNVSKELDASFDYCFGDANYIEVNSSYIVRANEVGTITDSMPFCHQCIFNKKAALEEIPYDESYRVSADYDMYLRAYLAGKQFKKIDLIISNYEIGGFSKVNQKKLLKEKAEVRYKNGCISNPKLIYALDLIKVNSKNLIKSLLPKKIISILKSKVYS